MSAAEHFAEAEGDGVLDFEATGTFPEVLKL
jgi:hypothetical protein